MARELAESLRSGVPAVFDAAQRTASNHTKTCAALHKLHLHAIAGSARAERLFVDLFLHMLARALPAKPGAQPSQRVCAFVTSYIRLLFHDDGKATGPKHMWNALHVAEDEDAVASRFVARLISWLLPGLEAKEKNVRLRIVTLLGDAAAHSMSLEDDLLVSVHSGLSARSMDKESSIRSAALVALSKLDAKPHEPATPSILASLRSPSPATRPLNSLSVLLDRLALDPSADVRRTALLYIPLTPATLPDLLSRARDADPSVRRALFTLSALRDPHVIDAAQRVSLVRTGLGDRDASVRRAVLGMLGAWVDIDDAEIDDEDDDMARLVRFVELFGAPEDGSDDTAARALEALFQSRKALCDGVVFDASFWEALTPASALLARVCLLQHLSRDLDQPSDQNGSPGDHRAPFVTLSELAFLARDYYDTLLALLEEDSSGLALDTSLDKEIGCLTFVVRELLHMAASVCGSAHAASTNESDRVRMGAVVREMLVQELLPDALLDACLDVALLTAQSEREFVRVVVEVLIDLREAELEPDVAPNTQATGIESDFDTTQMTARRERSVSLMRARAPEDMTPAERAQAEVVDLRCLAICAGMLERTHGTLAEHSTLDGVLHDLIVPCTKSARAAVKERALRCMGLCCLLAKELARESLPLLVAQAADADAGPRVQVLVLQIIFDALMVHGDVILVRPDDQNLTSAMLNFFVDKLEHGTSPAVQAVVATGLAKLMVGGIIADIRILMSLVLAYVAQATDDNQRLRQCLACFLPLYCYSSAANRDRMRSVACKAAQLLVRAHEELEDDGDMIDPATFARLLGEWTDPRKAAKRHEADAVDEAVHVHLAVDTLKILYDEDVREDEKRVMVEVLEHLYLPSILDDRLLLTLHVLLDNLDDQCPLEDPSTTKLVRRFTARFAKAYAKQLAKVDAAQFANDKEFGQLYKYIGLGLPSSSPSRESEDMGGEETPNSSFDSSRSKRSRSSSGRSSVDGLLPMARAMKGRAIRDETRKKRKTLSRERSALMLDMPRVD